LGRCKKAYIDSQQANTFAGINACSKEKCCGGKQCTTSYVQSYKELDAEVYKDARKVQHRRFSKSHSIPDEPSSLSMTNPYVWLKQGEKTKPMTTEVMGNTQEPHLKRNTWNYSYQLKSNNVRNQPTKVC